MYAIKKRNVIQLVQMRDRDFGVRHAGSDLGHRSNRCGSHSNPERYYLDSTSHRCDFKIVNLRCVILRWQIQGM